MPVLPVEDVERLDAAEAIERKRRASAGIGRMWGPPCQRAQRCVDPGCSDDGYAVCPAFSSDASSRGGAMILITSIGRRVRRSVVVGGMVDGMTPSLFARGRGFLAAHLLHDFGDVHGLAVHQMLFGLTG